MYQLARGVTALLHADKFPVPVLYGAERMQRGAHTVCVIFERVKEADRVGAPTGTQRNPGKRGDRMRAVRAEVWAKSELPGARLGEHEDLCEQIVDAVCVAVSRWAQENRYAANLLPVSAGFIDPPGLGKPEAWAGAVYALRWDVPTAVFAADYLGAGLPEGTVSDTSLQVRIARIAPTPPETIP